MDVDFLFIVSYECPRCHEALEARVNGPPTWLRCPSCGRASLPPEHERPSSSSTFGDDSLVIGNFGTFPGSLPLRPRAMAPLPITRGSKASSSRVLMGTGLFLTALLFVFSLLESNNILSIFSGLMCVVFLILLLRPTRQVDRG